MNILDHISESLETIFWVKMVFKFFDEDPGSGNLFYPGSGIRDGKIRIRNTSAEDVDGDPGPRHEADGQAGQTKH